MEKNSQNTVLILGDSTSMSMGLENKMYPFLIAKKDVWPDNYQIINSSLPGMTAADSSAFYFRNKTSLLINLRVVIIYLGNCDTASTEVRKGKYRKIDQIKGAFRENLGIKIPKTKITNRLLYFEWNNTIDTNIESPEKQSDFKYNIDRIIKDCQKRTVPIIIIRPKANLYFPSGIGKGNFIFYRYLGIKDKIADKLKISDPRFKEALALQETGQYYKATSIYYDILNESSANDLCPEYPLVVANNYAIAKAESGQYNEALYLLKLLLEEKSVRKEIILYNIARVYECIGENDNFIRFLKKSYEEDSSLYRIRSPYITAIDQLVVNHSSVKMINMHDIIPDNLYLDWCHPLYEGQMKLADKILITLKNIGIKGAKSATIRNELFNPELANGNISEFHVYFKTFAPFSESQIKFKVEELKEVFNGGKEFNPSMPELSSTSKELILAIEYYLRHPIFTSIKDILHFPPEYPSDIGRFPEYYLVRLLIPYLKVFELDNTLQGKFNSQISLLRTSDQLLSILPDKSKLLVNNSIPTMDLEYEKIRLPLIINKIRILLINHLKIGNQIHNRTKSAIFWYVRESLRFGSFSRYSMRYDRLLLEYLAEGLLVAEVLNRSLDNKVSLEIDGLIKALDATASIHEKYCSKFSLVGESDQLIINYDLDLKDVLASL
jgi:tetratricopeptide (TPR) repeat protein